MKTRTRAALTLATTLTTLALTLTMTQACQAQEPSTVYFTRDITPQGLLRAYHALGLAPGEGERTAVKISTGEAGGEYYLSPELIRELVSEVDGDLVECNTAYGGSRSTFKRHWETIHQHGFDTIARVVLMDERGDTIIPVKDTSHLPHDIVGKALTDYTFLVCLAHFKGHQMGGYGGVLKNQSIGVASASGKALIHSAGQTSDTRECWRVHVEQDDFVESMAAAAQAVHDYFGGRAVYINVMANMSIDCDCNSHPAPPLISDMGIVASLDPVAADQAALDMVHSIQPSPGEDPRPLLSRIEKLHGPHITEHAEKIGLGSRQYTLVDLDQEE